MNLFLLQQIQVPEEEQHKHTPFVKQTHENKTLVKSDTLKKGMK